MCFRDRGSDDCLNGSTGVPPVRKLGETPRLPFSISTVNGFNASILNQALVHSSAGAPLKLSSSPRPGFSPPFEKADTS